MKPLGEAAMSEAAPILPAPMIKLSTVSETENLAGFSDSSSTEYQAPLPNDPNSERSLRT
jgi:hypothetical protein